MLIAFHKSKIKSSYLTIPHHNKHCHSKTYISFIWSMIWTLHQSVIKEKSLLANIKHSCSHQYCKEEKGTDIWYGFWRYLKRRFIWHLSQSSIRFLIYVNSIVKSRSNPFLGRTRTKQLDLQITSQTCIPLRHDVYSC